jgi:hypothetical protein
LDHQSLLPLLRYRNGATQCVVASVITDEVKLPVTVKIPSDAYWQMRGVRSAPCAHDSHVVRTDRNLGR